MFKFKCCRRHTPGHFVKEPQSKINNTRSFREIYGYYDPLHPIFSQIVKLRISYNQKMRNKTCVQYNIKKQKSILAYVATFAKKLLFPNFVKLVLS